jgi:hypothetical protein
MMNNRIIINAGLDTLHVESVEIMSDDLETPFKIATPGGAIAVPPDSSYSVEIEYSPTAIGTHTAFFRMNHDAFPTHTMIQMVGNSCAGVAMTQPSIDFGTRLTATVHDTTISLVNAGNDALTITSARIESEHAGTQGTFFTLTDALPLTINADDSMLLHVQFMPSAGEGAYHGTLFLQTNSFPDTTITIALAAVASGVADVAMNEQTELSITPNPASDNLTIRSEHELRSLSVIDATGRTVLDLQVVGKYAEVAVSSLPAGSYYVKLETSEGTVLRKLVISR